jgi:hypothetical protein
VKKGVEVAPQRCLSEVLDGGLIPYSNQINQTPSVGCLTLAPPPLPTPVSHGSTTPTTVRQDCGQCSAFPLGMG